ncbi:hypothetical protein N7456_002249 [Penicillium angulare]|uniref:NACHT-NTPase and P-loop NTPases N-terminal domain-containing protein n=1 Tax=Penicillium angulare TaxID=116970 RepID=A0A9W9KPN0_9EURO|nr:hypothetical protein N7456_002249 [Penicillium angulare]
MAEALAVLGAVGSAVGLLDFTIKVVDRVNHFIRSVDEVPDTLRDVKLQLPLFIVALQRIQFHLDHGHFEPQTSLALKLSLDECLSQMIFLDNMLIKLTPVEKDSKIKRSRKAIYSLKEESILEKTVARISGYIEKLLLLQNSITSGNIMRNMSLVLKQMESQYSPRDGAASSSALESSGMVLKKVHRAWLRKGRPTTRKAKVAPSVML